jgi:hypothetical protein
MEAKSKNFYIGKEIQLYPQDTYKKFGVVTLMDEAGFVVKITKAHEKSGYEVNKEYFFSHSAGLKFKFV